MGKDAETEITRTHRIVRKTGLIAPVVLACVLVLSCAGIAWGAWSSSGSASSAVTTGTLTNTIHLDDGEQALEYPGAVIADPLTVTNDGTIDAYVRVKVKKAWLADGTPREDLDTALIGLDLNAAAGADWYDGGDGWYYYRHVLAPGERTSALFGNITVSTKVDNAYAGCTLRVCGFSESIQATAHAARDLWGQTFAEEGTSGSGAKSSAAVFTGPDAGFSFTPDANVLMGPFEQVLPGESYTRTFTVENGYRSAVTIGLKARLAAEGGDAATAALRRDFLQHHVTLRIVRADGTVIYDGPAWAEGSNTDGLLNAVLGTFSSGEAQTVSVTLSVDAAAGNGYEGIDASILGWELTAADASGDGGSSGGGGNDGSGGGSGVSVIGQLLPKTGDPASFVPWALTSVISGAALVVLLVWRRRQDDKERASASGDAHAEEVGRR